MHSITASVRVSFCAAALIGISAAAFAQAPTTTAPKPGGGTAAPPAGTPVAAGAATLPPDYVIGPDDVLGVTYWKDKEMSADPVVVRPDGKISLPLVNDIQAAGFTPDQLRANIAAAATKYQEDPAVTVVVKQINSRKVFITGEVKKEGAYPLNSPMTLMNLITTAGGLTEFSKGRIRLIRAEKRPDGTPWSVEVKYKDILDGNSKVLKEIMQPLKPGDTVIVK